MARVKRGVTGHAKHKKVLKAAKGYYGRRKNTIRIAKQAVEKANQYAYRDRKRRKRTFRALWIQRLNAAVRPFGLTYSRFIDGLGKAGLLVDRKVLSDLAIREPAAFQAIVERPRPRCRRHLENRAALMPDLKALESELLAAIADAESESALEAARVSAFGRHGSVSSLLKTLGAMTPAERKEHGAAHQRPQGPRHRRDRRAQAGAQRSYARSAPQHRERRRHAADARAGCRDRPHPSDQPSDRRAHGDFRRYGIFGCRGAGYRD